MLTSLPEPGGATAQLMKVSHTTVQFADQVQRQGIELLIAAVGAGKVSVSAAARIAALPAEQQQAVVARIEGGLKPKEALAQVHNSAAGQGAAWVDDEGRPLPESVCPAFRERPRFDQLCRRFDGLVRDVERDDLRLQGIRDQG
jgi:hypothetical protein